MWKLFLKKFRFYGYYFRWHEAVKFRHPILCAYKVGTILKKNVIMKNNFWILKFSRSYLPVNSPLHRRS